MGAPKVGNQKVVQRPVSVGSEKVSHNLMLSTNVMHGRNVYHTISSRVSIVNKGDSCVGVNKSPKVETPHNKVELGFGMGMTFSGRCSINGIQGERVMNPDGFGRKQVSAPRCKHKRASLDDFECSPLHGIVAVGTKKRTSALG